MMVSHADARGAAPTTDALSAPAVGIAPPDMTGRVRMDDGAEIYFTVHGEGPPLLLLHGGAGHLRHWALQIPVFAERYRVVSIDSRGHGRSTRTSDPVTYGRMAADVLAVMDALSIAHAAIVGWSDGGNIGLDIAISNPHRLDRLFAFGSNYDPSGLYEAAGSAKTVIDYMARARADYERLSATPGAYDDFMAQLTKMWSSEPTFTAGQLQSISTPVAICAGRHEEVIRLEHMRALATAIPGAEFVLLDEASHFAPWQAPDAFNEAVLNFLAGRD